MGGYDDAGGGDIHGESSTWIVAAAYSIHFQTQDRSQFNCVEFSWLSRWRSLALPNITDVFTCCNAACALHSITHPRRKTRNLQSMKDIGHEPKAPDYKTPQINHGVSAHA
jgi:hypothetical protein